MKSNTAAPDFKAKEALATKFPLRLETTTAAGARVVVLYRRIPVRKGFDVEAVILSGESLKEFEGEGARRE